MEQVRSIESESVIFAKREELEQSDIAGYTQSERECHAEFRMAETTNQGLTHEKPHSDTNGHRYHRSPDIDAIGVGRDTSRLRETRLFDGTNKYQRQEGGRSMMDTHRDKEENTSNHRCER